MNDEYDAVIVVGYRFEDQWKLPDHSQRSLRSVATLYKQQKTPLIVVSGKWSLAFDKEKITPPTSEAEEMTKALIALGVPEGAIIKEEHSKDTIGNAYFVKKEVVEPMRLHKLLIVCGQFHLTRVRYIFNKIFGSNYQLDYQAISVSVDPQRDQTQNILLDRQRKFLSGMEDGDDGFLKNKLYSDPFFQ